MQVIPVHNDELNIDIFTIFV